MSSPFFPSNKSIGLWWISQEEEEEEEAVVLSLFSTIFISKHKPLKRVCGVGATLG